MLVALHEGPLEALAAQLRERVEVVTAAVDLAGPDAVERVLATVGDRDVGLLVWNAAHAAIGRFHEVVLPELSSVLAVNVAAPLALVHAIVPRLVARGRGGVVLMASLAAGQGSALIATYSATKAFTRVLAEGLWEELRPLGVDVVAVAPGATDTPAYRASRPRTSPRLGTADDVARAGLDGLGRGPVVIPGAGNRAAAFLLQRLLGRKAAIAVVSRSTRSMYERRP